MLKVKYTRLLTGTPLAENPMDLFPQLRLCGGTMGVNPYAWRNKFCVLGGYRGKQIKDVKNPQKLAQVCAPYLFRATKQDWAKDLPEKTFSHLSVPMTKEQAKIYQEVRNEYCSMYDGVEITVSMAMAAMIKMQQISAGFVKNNDGVEVAIDKYSPKVQAALEWAQQFGQKNKFVIVATNVWVVRAIYHELIQAKFNVIMLAGSMNATEAERRFNVDDEVDGIVMSIKKGGVGLTLLGSANRSCADMLHVQQSWSYIERQQANDRIHRIGQHHPCTYTDILSSPLEYAIVASLQQKRDANESVLRFLRGFDDDGMRMVGGTDVFDNAAINLLG